MILQVGDVYYTHLYTVCEKPSPTKNLLSCASSSTLRIQACPKEGITPIHSYSFRMGLEPSILLYREGSGSLGVKNIPLWDIWQHVAYIDVWVL